MDDWDAPDGIDLNGPLPHHKILAIDVSGGFLDGTRLEFVDGLNCIIGGRGTGKTTVLEFIRYVLAACRTRAFGGVFGSVAPPDRLE